MEWEQMYYTVSPSYIEDTFTDKTSYNSWETVLPLLEESLSPNSIQDGAFGDEFDERLREIETDLMDLSSMNQDVALELEHIFDESELGMELFHETKEYSPPECSEEELMENVSLTDLLLMGAEAVEAQNWSLSTSIVSKLKEVLVLDGENEGNSFNRLALFFTQALHYKSNNPSDGIPGGHYPRQVDTISAFQVLQELSPNVKFAHFTANQAILEATQGDQEIHVIDFDILEGSQWPPLMVDLAKRKDTRLKVTAIVGDLHDAASIQQTGRRLKEYANSINLRFQFEQMVVESEDDFGGIESSHALIGNCMIHQLHMPNRSFSLFKTFWGGMSRLSPKLVVLVQEELFNFDKVSSVSFVDFFCEALHHYSALSESLESSFCGGYKVGLRQIEEEFFGVRIFDCLGQFHCEKEANMLWCDGLASLKRWFKPIGFSSSNVSQANFLATLFSGEYWIKHERCKLALCWKSRPLTAASTWVPTNIKKSSALRDFAKECVGDPLL